jgi:hypothetical protein
MGNEIARHNWDEEGTSILLELIRPIDSSPQVICVAASTNSAGHRAANLSSETCYPEGKGESHPGVSGLDAGCVSDLRAM